MRFACSLCLSTAILKELVVGELLPVVVAREQLVDPIHCGTNTAAKAEHTFASVEHGGRAATTLRASHLSKFAGHQQPILWRRSTEGRNQLLMPLLDKLFLLCLLLLWGRRSLSRWCLNQSCASRASGRRLNQRSAGRRLCDRRRGVKRAAQFCCHRRLLLLELRFGYQIGLVYTDPHVNLISECRSERQRRHQVVLRATIDQQLVVQLSFQHPQVVNIGLGH
ncbi:MAG: hypothetical protein WEC36_02620 [Phycisphaeraceae bacterium]